MKFVQENYLGTKQILKFPDHAVAMTVTVDDTNVVADEYGQKLVPAGTIVGGNGVLLDGSKLVADVNIGAKNAQLTTTFTATKSNILFTAKERGTAGNSVTIAFTDPAGASKALGVTVTGSAIAVSLATDASSTITSKADDVIEMIMNTAAANALVDAVPAGADGTGVVEAMAATALTGGEAGAGGDAEGVLMNDVDVTYGPNTGAMVIHGFININRMPVTPSATDIAALKQITFLG